MATAPAYVTLEELKRHLNIDASFTADDALILAQASAAEGAIAADLDLAGLCELEERHGELPQQVRLAILMLTAHFYASREPVVYGATVAAVPLTLEYLVAPYRRFGTEPRPDNAGAEFLTVPKSAKR